MLNIFQGLNDLNNGYNSLITGYLHTLKLKLLFTHVSDKLLRYLTNIKIPLIKMYSSILLIK